MNDMSFGMAILCVHILTFSIVYNFLMKGFLLNLFKKPVPILVIAHNRYLIIFPEQIDK